MDGQRRRPKRIKVQSNVVCCGDGINLKVLYKSKAFVWLFCSNILNLVMSENDTPLNDFM